MMAPLPRHNGFVIFVSDMTFIAKATFKLFKNLEPLNVKLHKSLTLSKLNKQPYKPLYGYTTDPVSAFRLKIKEEVTIKGTCRGPS